ncbi:MAG: hypothetical protein WBC18_18270 [Ottowia sp.]|uniref:hypothetical protein n=1 Tax=unclassified Ottowia TaxID=2645081 RepID=UPI003C30022D
MNMFSPRMADEVSDARREVEAFCQGLVEAGAAQWRMSESGEIELHMESGEAYLLGEQGITRLK